MDTNFKNNLYKSVVAGLLGILGISLAYWLILFLVTKNPAHPLQQFVSYKYWMSALIAGFGVQVGLYRYSKLIHRAATASAKSSMAASAGVSTTAMIACCAHHVVDILPLLGLSAAALILSKYQVYFLLLGILSNLLGIGLMIYYIKFKK